ncbi:MAG: hypothetical protein Q4A07_09820 [Coriobacteriales bacterium]|nr:hypothetical protein [Coriobacteriales bacterium]
MKRRIIAAVAVAIAALCVCAFPAHALASTAEDELDILVQEVNTQVYWFSNSTVMNSTFSNTNSTGNGAIFVDGGGYPTTISNFTNNYMLNGTEIHTGNATSIHVIENNDTPVSNSTSTPAGNSTNASEHDATVVPVDDTTGVPSGNSTVVPGDGSATQPKSSKKDLAQVATAKLEKKPYAYTGRAIKPKPTVQLKAGGKTLTNNVDYTLQYEKNKNAGTGYVYVNGKGKYTGTIKVSFTIKRAKNKITKVTAKKTIKTKALKKGKKKFQISATVKGKAKKTFKKTYVSPKAAKYITVSSAGKVTVKKGIKKGTYKLKVKITAQETANYRKTTSTTKTIKICIK